MLVYDTVHVGAAVAPGSLSHGGLPRHRWPGRISGCRGRHVVRCPLDAEKKLASIGLEIKLGKCGAHGGDTEEVAGMSQGFGMTRMYAHMR